MTNTIKNLIIISIDSLRADCIGANPDKQLLKKYKLKTKLKTPILDWFVKNGVFFNNCITVAPYTTSAHASVLTGQWPYRHGLIDFFGSKLKSKTILEILKKEGFLTLWQTDFSFLLGPILGFARGVDKFVKGDEEISFRWLKKNRQQKLACFFHFADVHSPYGFHNLRWGRDDYRQKVSFLLKKYQINPDKKVDKGKHFAIADFSREEEILRQNYAKVIEEMHRRGLYDEIMNLYIGGINYFNKKRFRFFWQKIKELELADNSLIIVAGDHGEAWDKNNRGHFLGNRRDCLNNEIIKVPLIFSGPALPRGNLIKSQVRTIDIVPTIFSLLNLKKYQRFCDGFDLSKFKNPSEDLPAFSQLWFSYGDKITAFMRQTKRNKKMLKAKPVGYLAAVSLWFKGCKLTQNFSDRSKIIKSAAFFQRHYPPKNRKILSNKMETMLKKYNQLIQQKNTAKTKIKKANERKIVRQLRSLGYKI